MSDLKNKLVDIVADHLDVPKEDVVESANFVDDLNADSLDTVELIMRLEKELDLDIPDDEAEKMLTFGAVLDYLTRTIG